MHVGGEKLAADTADTADTTGNVGSAGTVDPVKGARISEHARRLRLAQRRTRLPRPLLQDAARVPHDRGASGTGRP